MQTKTLAVLTAVTVLFSQAPDSASQDSAVYDAVLRATIRPEVDRMSAGSGLRTPAPVLALDRTLRMCRPDDRGPRYVGCVRAEEIQSFATKSSPTATIRFEGLLTPASRRELSESFLARNGESRPFPVTKIDGLIATSADTLETDLKRESGRTLGFVSFSLPSYSADDHALVYGSYTCGGLCGYGWLFLLERRGNVWKVVSVQMLWIS